MVVNLDIFLLEFALLLILVAYTLRSFQITDQKVIFIAIVLLLAFGVISIFGLNRWKWGRIRIMILVLLIVIVYGFLLQREVKARIADNNSKSVHDGVILTEASYRALISGENPYSVNFTGTLIGQKYFDSQIRPTIHYPYSPLMFLTSVPVFFVTERLFGIIDMRITLFVFFLLSAWIGALVVREKILFLILFLLNPLFVPMIFYGANEVILLFFLILVLYFLNGKKTVLASASMGLVAGTKLLFAPVVPLYFIYIFLVHKKDRKAVILNLKKFLLVSLLIYLPFLIWNSSDTLGALLSPWFGAGEELYPIAGFVGVAQFLTSLGVVTRTSTFPFLILFLPFEIIFLVFSFRFLKKSLSVHILTVLFAFNFILVLAFSRLVQTYYLAFISQILLLSAFVGRDKKE